MLKQVLTSQQTDSVCLHRVMDIKFLNIGNPKATGPTRLSRGTETIPVCVFCSSEISFSVLIYQLNVTIVYLFRP